MDRQTKRECSRTSVASSIQDSEDSNKGNGTDNGAPDDCLSGNQMDVDGTKGSGSDGGDLLVEGPLSPGTRALMCDEEDTMFMSAGPSTGLGNHCESTTQKSSGYETTTFYAEQERLVLTGFRDFLNRLITCGSIKETMCSPLVKSETRALQKTAEDGIIRTGTEARSYKEPYGNVGPKSAVSITAESSQTLTTVTSTHNHDQPLKFGLPIGNGVMDLKIKNCN